MDTQAVETKKARKSWSVILEDASKARLVVRLEKRKSDFKVAALHITTTGKGKAKKQTVSRGASSLHPTDEAAKKAQAAVIEAAIKGGWVKKEPRAAFATKPDSFTIDSLPKAVKK